MIWFKISTHDYMDMYPEASYRMFNSETEARDFCRQMQGMWSGTVTFKGAATKDEVLAYINKHHIELDETTAANVNNDNNYQSNNN